MLAKKTIQASNYLLKGLNALFKITVFSFHLLSRVECVVVSLKITNKYEISQQVNNEYSYYSFQPY